MLQINYTVLLLAVSSYLNTLKRFFLNEIFKKLFFLVPVPFPLPQEDACQYGVTCPVASGSTNTEYLGLAVIQQYPAVCYIEKFDS